MAAEASAALITYTTGDSDLPTSDLAAKTFVSSLWRTLFSGKIIILNGLRAPIFSQKRETCDEFYFPRIREIAKDGRRDLAVVLECALEAQIDQAYESIAICSPVALAARNIDHLVDGTSSAAVWRDSHFFLSCPANNLRSWAGRLVDARSRADEGRIGEYEFGEISLGLPRANVTDVALQFPPKRDVSTYERWQLVQYLESFQFDTLRSIALHSML